MRPSAWRLARSRVLLRREENALSQRTYRLQSTTATLTYRFYPMLDENLWDNSGKLTLPDPPAPVPGGGRGDMMDGRKQFEYRERHVWVRPRQTAAPLALPPQWRLPHPAHAGRHGGCPPLYDRGIARARRLGR